MSERPKLEHLKVKCGFSLVEVVKCRIYAEYGEHVRAEMTAVVKAQEAKDVLIGAMEERIEICSKENVGSDLERERILFRGSIDNAEITEEGRYAVLLLSAVSNTWKMDIEKKSRSFQDLTCTYREIGEKIAEEYGAGLIWTIPDKQLEQPLIQYQETDFQFIKRMASRLGQGVIASGLASSPSLYIGLPDRAGAEEIDLRRYSYSVFPYHGKGRKNLQEKLPRGCRINGMDDVRIGDELHIQNRIFHVMESQITFQQGAWHCECCAFPKSCFKVEEIPAETLKGAVLTGTVLDTKGEKVKLHLDIDAEQPVSKACEFPWRPITGNIVYCMPEKGTKAALYFRLPQESAGAVIYNIRENGEQDGGFSDVQNRYFTTDKGKQLYLKPGEMGLLHTEQTNAQIALQDLSGMHIKTRNRITIQAEGEVRLKGKRVMLTAPKEATIVRKDLLSPTVVNICNVFDAIGGNGNFKPIPQIREKKKKKIPMQKVEEYAVDDILEDILSNIPTDGMGDSAMECIAGSMPIICKLK